MSALWNECNTEKKEQYEQSVTQKKMQKAKHKKQSKKVQY